MEVIWPVFLGTGVTLLALGVVGLRWKRNNAPVFRTVGRFLLVLAVTTALFPSLLAVLGPALWAALYVGIVVVVTVAMTAAAVAKSRALRP